MCSLSNPESISLQNRTHFSWHCHAKALRHKSWTFNPLPSTPTCGPCETSNCSWVVPLSEAFPSSHFLRPSALTQASSTVPKRPPQMPPRNWSFRLQSLLPPKPSPHPTDLPAIHPPFRSLFYLPITHWIKNNLPKSQWLSNCGSQTTRKTCRLPANTQLPGPTTHLHLRQQASGSWGQEPFGPY